MSEAFISHKNTLRKCGAMVFVTQGETIYQKGGGGYTRRGREAGDPLRLAGAGRSVYVGESGCPYSSAF